MSDTTLMIILKLLAVLVLVFINGFFVAAEFALVKIRDTQLEPLIAKGSKTARVVQTIIRNLDASLSACQLGITLASLALGWVGEPVFTALMTPVLNWLHISSDQIRHYISFVIGFSALTFLHIVAGEQAPKWLAIQNPIPTSLVVARPLRWFHKASYPFIWMLNHAALWLLRRVGIQQVSEAESVHSEEELRIMVATSQAQSASTPLGRDIVLNALDLKRRLARDVMRPRQEIVTLSTDMSVAECIEIAEKTRYSRFPLAENGDIDRTIGVLHFKDIVASRQKAAKGADLAAAARKLVYVPPSARLEKLLQLLLERKLHMALVVDEYGGTVGLVTLENILEELVGQIQDEFDQEKPLLQRVGEQTWEVSGALPLHELAGLVQETLPEEDIITASGLVTHRLGGFPHVGDKLEIGAYELKVEELEGMRVARLKVTKKTAPPSADQ